MISIDKSGISEYTMIPNSFLDTYLADAGGDHVKVYLYLLRRSGADKASLEIASVCEGLNMSEQQVNDALKYWEEEGLLELFRSENRLVGIRFHSPAKAAKARQKHRLTAERVRQLQKEDREAKEIIFLAETYFGRPLTITETADLLYLHDKLEFSPDLCDYLLQYSVTHGAKNMNYPKTVALAWHSEGIRTAEQAKAHSSLKKESREQEDKRGARPKNAKKNPFLDYDHHDYDLKALAKAAKE